MGDIADYCYDQAMDAMYDGRYDGDDYYAYGHGYGRAAPRVLTCRRCGKTGLTWGVAVGGWKMFAGGRPHVCTTTTTDDFDVLE